MEQGTITAKIGYLFFVTVDKACMAVLLEKSLQEMSALYGGITLSSGQDKNLPPILADLKTGEDFLHGGNLTFPCRRYLWEGVECAVPQVPGIRLSDSHVLLSLYHDSGVCQVGLHFTAEVDSPAELVYLRQRFGSPEAITPEGLSIMGVADKFFAPLGVSATEAETGYLMEINHFYGVESLEDAVRDNAQAIYGMMTGDEGYDYVPMELVNGRLNNRWASRDFFSTIAFRNNFLLFHLVNGQRAEDYRAYQRAFGTAHYGSPNPYFFMNAKTGGVNHGLYFAAETGMVAKAICSNVLNHQSRISHASHRKVRASIQTTKELRRDLIITLNRLESIGIAELGELDRLIMAGLEIDPMVERIKYLLELLESELDLLYQTSTNALVNILTVAGVLLSAIQVVFCFV